VVGEVGLFPQRSHCQLVPSIEREGMVGVDVLTICCCCDEKGQVAKLHEQRLSWHWSLARDHGYSRATSSGDNELPGQAAPNVFRGGDSSIDSFDRKHANHDLPLHLQLLVLRPVTPYRSNGLTAHNEQAMVSLPGQDQVEHTRNGRYDDTRSARDIAM
jgi:hypothetical protein